MFCRGAGRSKGCSKQLPWASSISNSLHKTGSPDIVSLFCSTWKWVDWLCVSFLQTLPPSQSPRAMKQPRDDKPYCGARHQQCPCPISNGTEMILGKGCSLSLPSSLFLVHWTDVPVIVPNSSQITPYNPFELLCPIRLSRPSMVMAGGRNSPPHWRCWRKYGGWSSCLEVNYGPIPN